MENTETQVWLNFANQCGYITEEEYQKHYKMTNETGNLINYMIKYPQKFALKPRPTTND
jgi:four helix bundle protein